MMKLLLLTKDGLLKTDISGLQAIGGAQASGLSLKDLKYKDDYAIVASQNHKIQVHNLRTKNKAVQELGHLESCAIDDLTFIAFQEAQDERASSLQGIESLLGILGLFQKEGNFQEGFQKLLSSICTDLDLQFGFVVAQNLQGQYELAGVTGLDPTLDWLHEPLIKRVIETREKVLIQNLVGSVYQNNLTLMNAGFLSLYAAPLIHQSQVLGVIAIGSKLPHQGLSREQEKLFDLSTGIGSLLLHYYLKEMQLQKEIQGLQKQSQRRMMMSTQDSKLMQTLEIAERVAASPIAILIQGETGVGKELLAQAIHQKSERAAKPFVAINCGAIPAELLESLLFGHKRGAFTGAIQDQMGKFQKADGGTLFLDEIGDLPLQLQVKLLRVLQEKKIEPLGSQQGVKVDVRVIAASHKNIHELTLTGQFRSDLFFRLAEMTLVIPPMRDRMDDIILLADEFLKLIDPKKKLSREAILWLRAQPWPGNVRELQATIRRATILAKTDEIHVADFQVGRPDSFQSRLDQEMDWLGGKDLDEACSKFIHDKVRIALSQADGKRARAAELLGINTRTLFRYLENM
jgi:two-component system, NtrC family, response regulator HydG